MQDDEAAYPSRDSYGRKEEEDVGMVVVDFRRDGDRSESDCGERGEEKVKGKSNSCAFRRRCDCEVKIGRSFSGCHEEKENFAELWVV